MTATPIPRTLALTVYGDLSVSEIAKPPADRKPIVTAWVGAERSSAAYERLRGHLDEGRQAYVVCPLIELSETRLARAAEEEAERLRRAELRGEGQLLGTRQSGLSDLRFTRLRADRDLLESARELASVLVHEQGPWHDEADRLLSAADVVALA